MTNLKRYRFANTLMGSVEHPEGEWVRYDDITKERLSDARRIITDHVLVLQFVLSLPEAARADLGVRVAAEKELASALAWLAEPDEPEKQP